MIPRISSIAILLTAVFAGCAAVVAQQTQKPLTNRDVTQMVKGGLSESLVVSSIQSHPGKYDTSPAALVALHKAGVTEAELNAMMAASGSASSATAATSLPAKATPGSTSTASTSSSSKSRKPKVTLVQNGVAQALPLEKTQLATTKTKPSSMKSLAADSVLGQSLQSGINTATYSVASRTTSAIGNSSVQQAGSIFSGIVGSRKSSVTYVWGVPNPASTNILQTDKPEFSVDFSNAASVNPGDFEPAIVKLTPAQNTCRIIGATQGKQDLSASVAADWAVYSSFLEERVAVNSQKLKPGQYKISPKSELPPGEYGVVLRPVSKSKKFSGGDVARAQGEGLLFDAVWTFHVPDDSD
jgi:hypothetical protein